MPIPSTSATQIEHLDEWLQSVSCQRLFLVADEAAFRLSGAARRLEPILAKYHVTVFSDFAPNPNLRSVINGCGILQPTSADAVVAIGGGTAMDLAKLISMAVEQDQPHEIGKVLISDPASQFRPRRVPMALAPTTAGTGSEATQFAVLYVNNIKFSISDASLLPDCVVLDSTLTHSLPPAITATTGLDALCQAIESMWSVRSTAESIQTAAQALRLGLDYLEACVRNPTPEHRAGMMRAANLAGQAINISRTTAAHALSYHLTIEHGIPHGQAVALSLGSWMRFNGDVTSANVHDPRGVNHVNTVLTRIANAFGVPSGIDAMDIVASRWEDLLRRIDCRVKLSEFDIFEPNQLTEIVTSVNNERLANNPRRISQRQLTELVQSFA
ncbi:MAG: phosphonoacetaldehyde reductase [Planctomycetota bacterium]